MARLYQWPMALTLSGFPRGLDHVMQDLQRDGRWNLYRPPDQRVRAAKLDAKRCNLGKAVDRTARGHNPSLAEIVARESPEPGAPGVPSAVTGSPIQRPTIDVPDSRGHSLTTRSMPHFTRCETSRNGRRQLRLGGQKCSPKPIKMWVRMWVFSPSPLKHIDLLRKKVDWADTLSASSLRPWC